MSTRYHRYHCDTCGVDSESYSVLTHNESLAFFREHSAGHAVTLIPNVEPPPFPPPAASAAMSGEVHWPDAFISADDRIPTNMLIFSNIKPDDLRRLPIEEQYKHASVVIPLSNEPSVTRIPPPAVFVVTHDDGVVHESELEILAIFGTQSEAETWLDADHPGWRAEYSDYAVEQWDLGPPKKERDA